MTDKSLLLTIAILGGTGKEGKGLAYLWAKAGYKVLIGSRTPPKAVAAAKELNALLGDHASFTGLANTDAAQQYLLVDCPFLRAQSHFRKRKGCRTRQTIY